MSEIINILNNFFVLIPLTSFLICASFLLISAFTVGLEHEFQLPSDVLGFENPMVTAGLSKIPLMIGLTVTFMSMTIMNLIIEGLFLSLLKEVYLIGGLIYYTLSIILCFVTFIASLFVAGYLLKPLEKAIANAHLSVSYEFQIGKVNSEKVTQNFGEVKVVIDSREHFLHCVIEEGQEEILYGSKVIIKRKLEEDKYLIELID